ncbi:hypothetical protein I4F81_002445 [Pyropia yezoensis]|uniref:Uncharacterized protein n=1 Tax=Pyropia yezoensis TaxID=2788 RepID=A0ACC3BPU6_PYRYE|nr:hypothetical protein I4F81_002445 [Neopyropia yezoensis]
MEGGGGGGEVGCQGRRAWEEQEEAGGGGGMLLLPPLRCWSRLGLARAGAGAGADHYASVGLWCSLCGGRTTLCNAAAPPRAVRLRCGHCLPTLCPAPWCFRRSVLCPAGSSLLVFPPRVRRRVQLRPLCLSVPPPRCVPVVSLPSSLLFLAPAGIRLALVQPTSGDVNLFVRVLPPTPGQPPNTARIGDVTGVALLDIRSPAQAAAVGPPGTVLRLLRARPTMHQSSLHIGVSKWGAIERARGDIELAVNEDVCLSDRVFGVLAGKEGGGEDGGLASRRGGGRPTAEVGE